MSTTSVTHSTSSLCYINRRWFITEAERADQPESIIAAVVGHKRHGMTLGRYSAGPLLEQARRCVEAVKLPVRQKPRKR